MALFPENWASLPPRSESGRPADNLAGIEKYPEPNLCRSYFTSMAPILSALILALGQAPSSPPLLGQQAPSFDLRTLSGDSVSLAGLLKLGPVVLVVLRGYPGYQCPFCTKQVGDLMGQADGFARGKASVVLVYPGPAASLDKYAGEFVAGKDIPKNFRFTLDPGYGFTKSYGLRWDAPHETAYPSTFVIGRDGRIAYEKISRTHGNRARAEEVLAAIAKLPSD